MNQYLVDQIVDHSDWIRYTRPRKMCYSDDISKKYDLDNIIVAISESYYKYSAELYLQYYMYLIVAE
jgi:hypothetical protein